MSSRDRVSFGELQPVVGAALAELSGERVTERIWDRDHTVWKPEPGEVSNRLGWLDSPENSAEALPEISDFAEEVRSGGFTHVLLLGMGGSSLAPEVFRYVLGVRDGYPDLSVLDSTDPGAVLEHAESLDLSRTLFVVSTKSGGTVETFSFFKFFYNRVAEEVGEGKAGAHFVAITDPGSGLQDTAEKYGFRKTFLNDPNIGGRYSALSHFGLVPAALIGADLDRLLDRAASMARACREEENPAATLGAAMGALAREGNPRRDKVTLLLSPTLAPFGAWVEQLVAESTGKEGRGILPVADEPVGSPESYGDDRLFVSIELPGEGPGVEALEEAGHPVFRIMLDGVHDLGGEMFRWELATAVAGRMISVNPFDQPDVESAKEQAREMVAEYTRRGALPTPRPTVSDGVISVYSERGTGSVEDSLKSFLSQVRAGDYIALQAYLQPTRETTGAIQDLRVRLRERTGLAVTAGYGPRFLHSTGQLHKGDGGNGLFVQITARSPRDASIPDEAGKPESSLTFGVLEEAQSLGDRQALLEKGRRVIRLDLDSDVAGGLERISAMLG